MSSLGNVSAAAGTLDAQSQLAKDLSTLLSNPNSSVAYAQVNADIENLAAVASAVIPGIGASAAFTALSADCWPTPTA